MTLTVTDLFAGAGGSSTGMMQIPGIRIKIAANHWQLVTDIHNLNHPDTDHAVVDLHQERPAFFPSTDILWASPECTKWSQANGAKMPAIEEGLFEDPLSDDAKNRSRLLMFDVLRFIEHHRYRLVIVENVVDIATQAKYRTAWTIWRQELRALGYEFRVMSLNSMHAQLHGAPAPQSRDRIYIVAWPAGSVVPDLDRVVRPVAYCERCEIMTESVQSFKPNRTVGRYKQAYVYCCPACGTQVEPGWLPAAAAIDWSVPGKRIGDRDEPLAEKTLARIAAGIARYWGAPQVLEAAGNTYDAADPNHLHHGDPDGYMRTWPADEPLRSLHTSNSKALAVPVEGRDGKDALPAAAPLRTQTTRAETALAAEPAFIAEMYGTSTARPVTDPAGTFTAGGNHHALVQPYYGTAREGRPDSDPLGTLTTVDRYAIVMDNNHSNRAREVTEALPTLTTATTKALLAPFVTQFRERVDRNLDPATEPLRTVVADGASHALVQDPFILERRFEYRTRSVAEPISTLTANDTSKALIHRHNGGGSEMTTPAGSYLRTLTTGGNVSLLQTKRTVTAADLAAARDMLDDVLFRMFLPHEVAAGMAFPADYKWQPPNRLRPVSNRDLVKAAGNAVTPPAARDLIAVAASAIFGEDLAA